MTPHIVHGLIVSPKLPSIGYAATAACEWPGISISGTTLHEPFARVGDDLANVVLRVEAAMSLAVELRRRRVADLSSNDRAVAPGTDLGQARILLDLDAPSLVIGEMPVERVHFVQRDEIDVLLDELLRHEVPRDVEVHAAPGKAWTVFDFDSGNRPRLCRPPALSDKCRREEAATAFASRRMRRPAPTT